MTERAYFKLVPGGHTEKVWSKFNAEYKEVWESWKAFANKYKVDDLYANNRLMGLIFDEKKPPKGWVSPRKIPHNVYKPARTKDCMEAYNELKALSSKPDGIHFAGLLGIDCVFKGHAMYMPVMETVGDEFILTLHVDNEVPEGVIPMKTSEYWAMKEALNE